MFVKPRTLLWHGGLMLASIALTIGAACAEEYVRPADAGSANSVVVASELKTVKIYGAGGFSGLDAYQSGFFVGDQGHILTVWSTVLDVDALTVVTSDGGRYKATVAGIDPNLEIAILATDERPANFFDLSQAAQAAAGQRVLALSNLYGIATGSEMSSVQRGVIMAVSPLKARRGNYKSVYQGPAYLIDAMTNNPGAAGGALVNLRGELVGLLGKELLDEATGIWINYAIPIEELKPSINSLMDGETIDRTDVRPAVQDPKSLSQMGVVLVPDVLTKTPAFVDLVQPDSPAAKAGLQSDDLVLFMNSERITSQSMLRSELKFVHSYDEVVWLVQRGNELHEIIIKGN